MLKVIVIGGGIGGLTLARACLDAGIEVEVYEKRSLADMLSGPGGIFIQRNAMQVYKLLWNGQIADRFAQQGGTILDGGFSSKSGEMLYFNSPRFINADNLGFCLLRSELQQILYESLPPETVKTECTFDSFEEIGETVKVSFQDGKIAQGNVLVAADGLYSNVKAKLQGKDRLDPPVYSGTCCWRGYFDGAGIPLDDRYSWGEFWGQGDRFGYFDVGANRFSFYAFANTPVGGTDDLAGGALSALKARFSGYIDPVSAMIEAASHNPIYRDDIFDREPLGQVWGKGQVTLIGDAAHPVLPSIGQGGCMAIEDAFELAKRLSTTEESVSVALRHFEASRNDRVTRVFNTSRQVGQIGQAESNIACFFRNSLYKFMPTKLADLQFRWLFDYVPEWKDIG
jgi:2-polyprenyl-6-methoxyphenol hydroxylase-like FAD-dependent oxidoreductase